MLPFVMDFYTMMGRGFGMAQRPYMFKVRMYVAYCRVP